MSDAQDTIATLRSQGNQITIIGAVMMALAIIAVGLRFLAKGVSKQKGWHWDDTFIALALIVYLIDEALILRAVDQGSWAVDTSSPEWSTFSLLEYIYSLLYWTIIALTTYSILLLYRNIFAIHKVFSICSHLIAAVVTVWWVSGTVIDARSYQPTEAFWNSSLTGEYVINYSDFWIGEMIIELSFEAALLILPVWEVGKLGLNNRKKILVTATFAMGGFVLITGILRIHYAWKSGDIIPGTIWLGVHGSVAIISACLPTYRPLLSKIPGFLPLTHRGTTVIVNGSWLSRRKDSIEHAIRYEDTLVDSHSVKDTSIHESQHQTDLPMLDFESNESSFASSTGPIIPIQHHQMSEELPRIYQTTARIDFG